MKRNDLKVKKECSKEMRKEGMKANFFISEAMKML